RSDLGDASVAAVSILESRADLVEQVLDEVFAVDQASLGQDLSLLALGLARKRLLRLGRRAAVSDEHASSAASSLKSVLELGQRDQLLNESLKLLGSAERRSRIAVSDELPLKVCQQGHSLIRG